MSIVTKIGWDAIEAKIRLIPQYSGEIQLTPTWVHPTDLRPICLYLRTYRLDQVKILMRDFINNGIALYEGVCYRNAPDGQLRVIPPPIIEKHGETLVIIDGLHRVYQTIISQQTRINVVIAEGQLERLPADILRWEEVQLTEKKLPRSEKFRNLDEIHFRNINKYIDDYN